MAFRYDDLYKIFNDHMINKYGLDWSEVYNKYLEIGNYIGRQGRHQCISWNPETIKPIGELISSKMPRIGVS